MELDESGKGEVYRASELTTFMRCPRQLGYRRLLGLKIRPSATMVGGTSIDDTLTEHHGQRIKGLNGLRGSALTDFFIDRLRKNTVKETMEGPLSGEPDPDVENDGVKVLPIYEKKMDPVIEPVAVQREVSKTYEAHPELKLDAGIMPAVNVTLVGHIDLVRKTSHAKVISDHKFTSKAPSQMNAGLSTQLHTYDELDGDGNGQVELILLRRLKTPDVVTTNAFVTKEQRGHVRMLLKQVAYAVRNHFFPMTSPDSWVCSKNWCGYFNLCRGREGGPLPLPGELFPPEA